MRNKEYDNAYSKAYRLDHLARGLCEKCPRPAVFGRRQCTIHRDQQRERNKITNPKYRAIYRKTGRCLRCSCPLEGEAGSYCTNCIILGSRPHREAEGRK